MDRERRDSLSALEKILILYGFADFGQNNGAVFQFPQRENDMIQCRSGVNCQRVFTGSFPRVTVNLFLKV